MMSPEGEPASDQVLTLQVKSPPCTNQRNSRLDLPLYSAALLSATFPYVSHVTRLPLDYANNAHHFGDGGYYDNDGVGSALEFLCFVFTDSPCMQKRTLPAQSPQPATEQPAQLAAKLPRILFIEIREGDDISTINPDSFSSQQPDTQEERLRPPQLPINQFFAPLIGFWLAGHDRITLRNRRELSVAIPVLGLEEHGRSGRAAARASALRTLCRARHQGARYRTARGHCRD
jgi:hypothetical protein